MANMTKLADCGVREYSNSPMSSSPIDFLDNRIPGRQPRGIGESEKWWVKWQEALKQAGYMLRSRYRPVGYHPGRALTSSFLIRRCTERRCELHFPIFSGRVYL